MKKQMEIKAIGHVEKRGPENTGSFATRSPVRPNPIMVSIIRVSVLDQAKGTILTPFLDAEPGQRTRKTSST